MSDEEKRALERAAADGDAEAKEKLKQLRRRMFDPSTVKTHEQHMRFARPPKAGAEFGNIDWRNLVWACGRANDRSHGGRARPPAGPLDMNSLPTWLAFSEGRDAWYCRVCDRWIESRCAHPDCKLCPNRPRQPSKDARPKKAWWEEP